MTHRVTLEEASGEHRAVCACRMASSFFAQRQDAEDWKRQHLATVERIRIHLSHGSTPPLADQARYYRKMSRHPNTPVADRPLWKQLADELDHRLGLPQHDDQSALW